MFSANKLYRQILCIIKPWYHNRKGIHSYANTSQLKVTVYGASSNIGQPLSLMLKQSSFVDELALYDTPDACGIGIDLLDIDSRCNVVAYGQSNVRSALKKKKRTGNIESDIEDKGLKHLESSGEEFLDVAYILKIMPHGAQVLIILAGTQTTKEEMKRTFDRNAIQVKEAVIHAAQYCPKACLVVASTPLEGMVPLVSEIMKLKGVYNSNLIFGVSTLNVIRANTITAHTLGLEPECVVVPIVGGNTGNLIVPVLTEAKPFNDFNDQEIECITQSVQTAQDKVHKNKSFESSVLSSAFAIARFVVSLIKGLKGQPNIVECAFVRTCTHPAVNYMNIPVILGLNGIKKDLGLPALSTYERCILEGSLPVLKKFEYKAQRFLGIKKRMPCDPCDPNPNAPVCPEDYCALKCKE